MKLYVGVNSDNTEVISKQQLKRYFDYETNQTDVLCWNDTQRPPHWMLDYEGIDVAKTGDNPIDRYLTLPAGAIKRMFGLDLTWEDEFKVVEL